MSNRLNIGNIGAEIFTGAKRSSESRPMTKDTPLTRGARDKIDASKLWTALASVNDVFVVVDSDGEFIETSDAFATFHRFDANDPAARQFAAYPALLDVFSELGDRVPPEQWPIARALPAGWSVPERMAAATLRLDRWEAGARLMQSANPQGWARVSEASELVQANRAALGDCRKAAVRDGKAQRCTLVLPLGGSQ